MSVVLSVEDTGPCRKKVKIEVPAAAVAAEGERALRDYARRAKIPGFRPGKAPTAVVRRHFQQEINEELVERLLPRYWKQAEAEAGFDSLLAPQLVDVSEVKAGEPLVFVAEVEARPEIKLGNTTDFNLPDPSATATPAEVDSALDELRREIAPFVPVERAAAQGDRVAVDVAEIPGPDSHGDDAGKTDSIVIEVGNPQVWEEMSVAVTGLAAGQKGEFVRGHGEADHRHEHRYRVEVKEVRERELPPLDDALAKSLGLDTVADLRTTFERRITLDKASRRRGERERALLDQLRERHPLALPVAVVNQELEKIVREYAGTLAQQGVDLERAGIDWRRVQDDARPLAEKKVHARLLLDAIAKDRNLAVDEQELERVLAQIARNEKTSSGAVRQALDRDGRLADLRSQILRSQTVRLLLGDEAAGGGEELAEIG